MRRICGVVLLSNFALIGADNADWIAVLGGRVERNPSGAITAVSLRGTWAGDTDLDSLLRLSTLLRLDLAHTRVSDHGLRHIAGLKGVIDLDLLYAERVTDEGVAALRNWTSLERLNLRGTKISDNALEHIARLRALKSLDVGYTEVTDTGLERLAPLTNLRELAIPGNKMTERGLIALRQLPDLTILRLGGAQRTDSGLWQVALTGPGVDALAALTNLEELDLSGTRLTDGSLDRLRPVKKLRRLNASRTQLTGACWSRLAAFPDLEQLSLAGNQRINDATLAGAAECTRLRWLDLSGTGVTAEGIASLKRQRPGLRID